MYENIIILASHTNHFEVILLNLSLCENFQLSELLELVIISKTECRIDEETGVTL